MNLKHLFLLLLCIFGFSCQQRYAHRAKVKSHQKWDSQKEIGRVQKQMTDTADFVLHIEKDSIQSSIKTQHAALNLEPQKQAEANTHKSKPELHKSAPNRNHHHRIWRTIIPKIPFAKNHEHPKLIIFLTLLFFTFAFLTLITGITIFLFMLYPWYALGFILLPGFILLFTAFIAPYFLARKRLKNKLGIDASERQLTLFFVLALVITALAAFPLFFLEVIGLYLLLTIFVVLMLIQLILAQKQRMKENG